jgi:hypothetical protein
VADMTPAALNVFVGHDSREAVATAVCIRSMRENSSIPLAIHKLSEPALRHTQLYRREWVMTNGQKFDLKDKKPFSTEFSFTRFLVPSLMMHAGWAVFVDADFLFLEDIHDLLEEADEDFAVQVVKHGQLTEFGLKMDGQAQQPYFRKNWSSLVLWNCGHPANQRLTPFVVNGMSGQWLHAFSWLGDDEIGELTPEWNYLSGISTVGKPKAVHFTKGIPDMPGWEDSPYADHWREVKSRL